MGEEGSRVRERRERSREAKGQSQKECDLGLGKVWVEQRHVHGQMSAPGMQLIERCHNVSQGDDGKGGRGYDKKEMVKGGRGRGGGCKC